MSLSADSKKIINKAIEALGLVTESLLDAQTDPRALDLIEIVASLLEQQCELDMSFEVVDGPGPIKYDITDVVDNNQNDVPTPEDLQDWMDMN